MKRWNRIAWFVHGCWLVPQPPSRPKQREKQSNEKNINSDCSPDRRGQHALGVVCISDECSAAAAVIELCAVWRAALPSGQRFLRLAGRLEWITPEAGMAEQQ